MLPRYEVLVPEYTPELQPDYAAVGNKVDAIIQKKFMGREAALRYLSLQDHSAMTLDELINTIEKTGTDRYDSNRPMSVAHEFYKQKEVELFAVPITIDDRTNVTAEALKDFDEGAIKDRGYSLRINLVVVYDLSQLEHIPIQYDDGVGEDAFKFKYPEKRAEAVLGFVVLK